MFSGEVYFLFRIFLDFSLGDVGDAQASIELDPLE
jgi:hypothetical protein